ncbi:hypothetical protein LLG96_11880 [bacterium]|nr:hypothetical protein [bacterium]
MNDYIHELKTRYTEDLARSAREFLEIGVNLFHRHRSSEGEFSRTAVDMLSTGTELSIKAFITEKNLGLIFRDIPPEIRVFLSCPESIPHFFQWRTFEPDIRAGTFETLDLNECISCFYIFFPHIKQLLLPHLRFLSMWGNKLGHNAQIPIEPFEFERSGYAVFQILSLLNENESSNLVYHTLTDTDRQFMASFETMRIERVKMAIDQAKSQAYEFSERGIEAIMSQNWDTFTAQCPICGYRGHLYGYTEIAIGEAEDGPQASLDFFATMYNCDGCGLKLNDIEEMMLANMAILYDRSEDLDRWFHDHRASADWFFE